MEITKLFKKSIHNTERSTFRGINYLKELQMSPNASSFLAAVAVVDMLGFEKRPVLPPFAGCAGVGLPHTSCVAKSEFYWVHLSTETFP